ncbi:MAG: hypothetical protein AB1641_30005 [Thermodesulfobacteriota bacterium]
MDRLKKKTWLLALAALFLLTACASLSRRPLETVEDERSGFNGLKWGVNVSVLGDLRPVETEDRVKIFRRKGDSHRIGPIVLNLIYYGFYRDLFCAAALIFEGRDAGQKIKETLVNKHGPPDVEMDFDDGVSFIWDKATVEISLSYNGRGALKYRYKPIIDTIDLD